MKKIFCIFLIGFCFSCNTSGDSENYFFMTSEDMLSTIAKGAKVTYSRKKQIERNDLIVFSVPGNKDLSCMRVIGMPGDKIEITAGDIYINNKKYERIKTSNSLYTVFNKDGRGFSALNNFYFKPYSQKYGMVCITDSEFQIIKNNRLVDSIYQLGCDSLFSYRGVIRTSTSKYNNDCYFGPIFIPRLHDTLFSKDAPLIHLYDNFNDDYTTIKDNYFFCVGDNFFACWDSRRLGLIPQQKILGTVQKIDNMTPSRITHN